MAGFTRPTKLPQCRAHHGSRAWLAPTGVDGV